ncbi:hypothetical protein FACS1894132_00730 [Clostridia bacterium]|nr:hypothetical protein FACS1894132_00730 [Clostridia bacterium]
MTIKKKILEKNNCYLANRQIEVKGLMLHSVGCNQPSGEVFVNIFNTAKPNGTEICVHGFIDAENIYQTLPWNWRGWHAGGTANNTHIGVEMTEPNTIRYTTGANFVDNNPVSTKIHVLSTYQNAIELFAFLCEEYKLDPLKDIISHSEGYKLGVASGHADPEHLWKSFGLTMDKFRLDVKAKMEANIAPTIPTEKPEEKKIYRVQVGAFTVKQNAENYVKKLKTSGFTDAFIV